jgi:hypothetical protein
MNGGSAGLDAGLDRKFRTTINLLNPRIRHMAWNTVFNLPRNIFFEVSDLNFLMDYTLSSGRSVSLVGVHLVFRCSYIVINVNLKGII